MAYQFTKPFLNLHGAQMNGSCARVALRHSNVVNDSAKDRRIGKQLELAAGARAKLRCGIEQAPRPHEATPETAGARSAPIEKIRKL